MMTMMVTMAAMNRDEIDNGNDNDYTDGDDDSGNNNVVWNTAFIC